LLLQTTDVCKQTQLPVFKKPKDSKTPKEKDNQQKKILKRNYPKIDH